MHDTPRVERKSRYQVIQRWEGQKSERVHAADVSVGFDLLLCGLVWELRSQHEDVPKGKRWLGHRRPSSECASPVVEPP